MKTSNKLLLGIFLTIILLTTAVQLMVYAKFKRGDYEKFNRDDFYQWTSVNVPAVRFISITGMGNISIIPADTAKLEIQKEGVTHITYRVVNDTLIINGDTSLTGDDLDRGNRNYNRVNVYLPNTAQINAAYCLLKVGGAVDSAHAPSYNIHLENDSYLGISDRDNDKKDTYFNQLHIEVDGSHINLHERTVVNDLHAKLISSNLNLNEAVIRNLTLDADNKSSVTLSGRNLKALK